MLPEKEKEHLKHLFAEKLKGKVELVVFTQEKECRFCEETREMVEDVAATSDKIEARVYDFVKDKEKAKELGIDKIPAIAILGEKDHGIRFFGIPSGYEFMAFVDDIVDVSAGASRLPESIKGRLKTVNKTVHIQVFAMPTCPYCPHVVRTAHQFAIESGFVKSDAVESAEFPQLVQKYNVMSVPKTVINEKVQFVGAMPEEQFFGQVLKALSQSK